MIFVFCKEFSDRKIKQAVSNRSKLPGHVPVNQCSMAVNRLKGVRSDRGAAKSETLGATASGAPKRETRPHNRQVPEKGIDLGQRVRALRTARQLTLKTLAERSSVSISSLSKIENNQLSPTYE